MILPRSNPRVAAFFLAMDKKIIHHFLIALCCASWTLSVQGQSDRTLAFPGAAGFGQFATGGRGGDVLVVTHLEDDGPGSFRQAAQQKGPRTIVFAVSGTIRLKTKLVIAGNATIAGQTAPGEGICLADQPVVLGGNNIIVQYLRFRMGDRYQNGGKVDGAGADDAFGGTKRSQIMVDHCSMSWSTDEVCSIYGGDSTTIQWCMVTEPLNYSYHFEEGDKDFEKHGFGGIWGGKHLSAHHNLFAHCVSRNPRFNGARLGADEELVDFRNNVIYNWGNNSTYGGEGGRYNMVGNYYKAGPTTADKVRYRIVNPSTNGDFSRYGKFFVADNHVAGNQMVTKDNRKGIDFSEALTPVQVASIVVEQPFAVLDMPTEPAEAAYRSVLAKAGASFRRDTLDARIIRNVAEGSGKIIDVQGGFSHGTDFAQTLSAWPFLRPAKPAPDQDQDGIPDAWETTHGLNPTDASDARKFSLSKSYTNIEVYIHSITLP